MLCAMQRIYALDGEFIATNTSDLGAHFDQQLS